MSIAHEKSPLTLAAAGGTVTRDRSRSTWRLPDMAHLTASFPTRRGDPR